MKKLTQNKELRLGLAIGLLGGIMGNILVTAMFRMVGSRPIYYDIGVFIIGVVLFFYLVHLLVK